MDQMTRRDIDALLQTPSGWYVSVYLPTVRSGLDNQQNPIRARNLLDQAEQQLIDRGMRAPEARELLRPGRDLLKNSAFWSGQGDALAMFCAEGLFRAWRLPVALREFLWTGKQFYLKPLWPLLADTAEYYLLAISQKRATLYRATTQRIDEVPSDELPAGMREALHYDQPEGMFQVHSGQPAMRGKESAVFTGKGGKVDAHKDDILAYFRQINAALHRMLRERSTPLLFAGVQYLFPLYQQVNTYDHLADTPVEGNADYLAPHELHQRSLDVARRLIDAPRHRDARRYVEGLGRGLSTSDISDTLHAAFEGRVAAMFVATDAEVWGQFDEQTLRVQFTPPSEHQTVDLLDLAATAAYRRGATVYAGPMATLPSGQSLATVMRHSAAAVATE